MTTPAKAKFDLLVDTVHKIIVITNDKTIDAAEMVDQINTALQDMMVYLEAMAIPDPGGTIQ